MIKINKLNNKIHKIVHILKNNNKILVILQIYQIQK